MEWVKTAEAAVHFWMIRVIDGEMDLRLISRIQLDS